MPKCRSSIASCSSDYDPMTSGQPPASNPGFPVRFAISSRLIGRRGFQGAIDYKSVERGFARLQLQAYLLEGVAERRGWTCVQQLLPSGGRFAPRKTAERSIMATYSSGVTSTAKL